jgi:glycosyltransferase involved in cell wall biosynthesis
LPLLGRKPDLLISLYAQPSYLCGWLIAKLRRVPTAFWCEPTFDRWVARSRLKEGIKRFVFSRVDMTIGSGQDGRNYAMRYGVAAQRARVLRHAVDIDHFREGRRTCLARRGALRAELGLHGLIFVYVGRLWWGKGLATLLEAFFRVQRAGRHPVGLLLVGDGPEEESLRHACAAHGIENVHFAGFRSKEELPRFLAAADVFVFPSLGDPYGLSVDEAMASSLPVISTTAAGEIASRIQPGLNGYLVPPEDSPTLAEAMLQFVHSPGLAEEMGQRSRHKLGAWTPERWAEALEAIVLTSLAPGAADEGHGIIVRSGSSDP